MIFFFSMPHLQSKKYDKKIATLQPVISGFHTSLYKHDTGTDRLLQIESNLSMKCGAYYGNFGDPGPGRSCGPGLVEDHIIIFYPEDARPCHSGALW